ncbi:hypothetical protein GH714_023873 [Hevea brasiliensis]|uniref:WRKY domain-containing protein n=1 Tax=Hevea brasiliensis TaxID=3981 RepID=A0A6A6MPF6_HEVBR|nr:hypothetical protein GH714_023873 [Hevea brasiliensis]
MDPSSDRPQNHYCGDEYRSISNGKRVITEMDFFADGNRPKQRPAPAAIVKNEAIGDGEQQNEDDVNTGLNLLTRNTGTDHKSIVEDGTSQNKEVYNQRKKELELLRAEINHMNAENQRLKVIINQVNNNYYTLQMHVVALKHQIQKATPVKKEEVINRRLEEKQLEGSIITRQFLDLGKAEMAEIGEGRSQSMSEERSGDCLISPNIVESMEYNKSQMIGSSSITEVAPVLDHLKRSDDGGIRAYKTSEEAFHGSVPNKVPKFNTSRDVEDEQQAGTMSMIRKTRVAVRARSEASMISDGCQWRKYGQKLAKGNPCPELIIDALCHLDAQSGNRCAEDHAVLITTYEGHHNHPLPPAATGMASTTSAAASMLLSGSMPSPDGLMTTNLLAKTLPCPPGFATLSASAPFPTVTLDFTYPPISNSSQRIQGHFLLPSDLNFPHNFASVPNVSSRALCNQYKVSGLLSPHQGMELPQIPPSADSSVSVAAAAITADPDFTAALVAAISSIIGNVQASSSANNGSTIRNSIDNT